MLSDEILNNINKYATMFPDIDPSIVKDIVETVDNEFEIITILTEINSTINKTDKERREEVEFNLGSKCVSDMKFQSKGGIVLDSSSKKKTYRKKDTSFKNIFSFKNKSNSDIKFQKFD